MSPTRSVPDLDSVPIGVAHGEHTPRWVRPFHGDTLGGERGGDGGGIVGVDAEADIAWTVTAPELYGGVAEPDSVGPVVIGTTAEEPVKVHGCLGIGDGQRDVGEHDGF